MSSDTVYAMQDAMAKKRSTGIEIRMSPSPSSTQRVVWAFCPVCLVRRAPFWFILLYFSLLSYLVGGRAISLGNRVPRCHVRRTLARDIRRVKVYVSLLSHHVGVTRGPLNLAPIFRVHGRVFSPVPLFQCKGNLGLAVLAHVNAHRPVLTRVKRAPVQFVVVPCVRAAHDLTMVERRRAKDNPREIHRSGPNKPHKIRQCQSARLMAHASEMSPRMGVKSAAASSTSRRVAAETQITRPVASYRIFHRIMGQSLPVTFSWGQVFESPCP